MTYSYKQFFRQFYESAPPRYACTAQDAASFLIWKADAGEHLRQMLGLSRLERFTAGAAPFTREPELLSSEQEEGYSRHKLRIQTLPGVFMPYYMLIPDGCSDLQPRKTMIAIPAHGASKESVAGVLSSPGVKEKLAATPKESYGLQLVKRGFLVFCPDPPGYGERLEPVSMEDRAFLGSVPINPLGSSCKNLTMTAEALGLTFAGLVLWDMMRLVDHIAELPFADTARLGCCGFSGGGLYTMWLAAMDERIRLAVISGYLHGAKESILETHLCPCNFVPGLWRDFDLIDIASLIAPRPAFYENGLCDVLNGPKGIDDPIAQFHKIQRAYGLFGKASHVCHRTFHGPHMWYGLGYDFIDKYFSA